MSLYKQLWLSVILLMLLIFGGILVVSSLSAKAYLEEQLYMKNSDNATALALSLTQQDADPVLLELTLSAQFDTGHYELIQLTDPGGSIIILREDRQAVTDAPAWFIRLLPISVDAGVAQIQQGWQQLGTLTLRSHSRFAYKELWENTQKQAGVFLLAMILAGVIGSYVLKIILRPLDDVVDQAEAIGERRFITIEEPSTKEFKAVVRSMNNLSHRIRAMLHQEAKRLEQWRRDSHVDKVTGLEIREPFIKMLASALERDDAITSGVLTIIRVADLAKLNQHLSRKIVDHMLAEFGKALTTVIMQNTDWAAGRLNGSDFAVLSPHAIEPSQVGRDIQRALMEVLTTQGLENQVKLPGASADYQHGDVRGELLTNLDATLLASEKAGESEVGIVGRGDIQILPAKQNLQAWVSVFEQGFAGRKFSLAAFPATDLDGELIHVEAPVRLQWEDQDMSAGQFLPWINRLELAEDLDKHVVDLALEKIKREGTPVCINLSYASIADPGFLPWLSDKLSSNPTVASQLWMEVQEAMAYRHLEAFKKMCIRVNSYGSKIGMEHMGHQLADIGQLHDVGLHYLKIDSAFIRGIDSNNANQTLLRTLCTLGHSLGVIVIGEGVQTPEEWSALKALGLDGATGPEVSRRMNEA
jgi:EAL domain-containing protein (putative c-di-GMP-specific phosphodiesterase class I)